MVLGIPIISTDCAGPNELLDFGKYGMLVENTEQGLYEGLNELINDSMILENMKKSSLERSKSFGVNRTIKAVESLLG